MTKYPGLEPFLAFMILALCGCFRVVEPPHPGPAPAGFATNAPAHAQSRPAGPPRVVASTPTGQASGQVRELTLTFDRPMDAARITIGDQNGNAQCDQQTIQHHTIAVIATLRPGFEVCYGGSVSSADGRMFRVRLTRPIPEKQHVRVQINPQFVSEVPVPNTNIVQHHPTPVLARDGSAMQQPYQWTFSTVPAARVVVRGVAVDTDGSIYAVGSVTGTLVAGAARGGMDAFVARFDAQGVQQWAHQIGSGADDVATAVVTTPNGVALTGYTDGALPGHASRGGRDVFMLAYTRSGLPSAASQLGTADAEQANGMVVDRRGDLYLAGRTKNGLPANIKSAADSHDILVMKVRQDGGLSWSRSFGPHVWRGQLLPAHEATEVALDGRGLPIVVGYTYGKLNGKRNPGAPSGFAMALDGRGRVRWTRLLPFRSEIRSGAMSGGQLLVAGSTLGQSSGFFARISSSGKVEASERYQYGQLQTIDGSETTVLSRLVVNARGQGTLVGFRSRYDRSQNTWFPVELTRAAIGRDGRVTGGLLSSHSGRTSSVLAASAHPAGGLCVGGSDGFAGYIRCFRSGARTADVDIALATARQ